MFCHRRACPTGAMTGQLTRFSQQFLRPRWPCATGAMIGSYVVHISAVTELRSRRPGGTSPPETADTHRFTVLAGQSSPRWDKPTGGGMRNFKTRKRGIRGFFAILLALLGVALIAIPRRDEPRRGLKKSAPSQPSPKECTCGSSNDTIISIFTISRTRSRPARQPMTTNY